MADESFHGEAVARLEQQTAFATVRARTHATLTLFFALVLVAVGVGFAAAVTPAGPAVQVAVYGALAASAAPMFMAWAHAWRRSNALAQLDEALLKLRAVWNDTATRTLGPLLQESEHLVGPQYLASYFRPYVQQRERYDIWRMTVGISTLADRLEAGGPLGNIPHLEVIGGLQESVRSELELVRNWTRDFGKNSADTISNAVRSGLADSLVGRADVKFDGWQAAAIVHGQDPIVADEEQTHLIRDAAQLRLVVLISRERPDQSNYVVVPILSDGHQEPDEIVFRIEARSGGLRVDRRSATVRWHDSSTPVLATLPLVPIRTGGTDLFVSTYLANRLLQTVRLRCRIDPLAVPKAADR